MGHESQTRIWTEIFEIQKFKNTKMGLDFESRINVNYEQLLTIELLGCKVIWMSEILNFFKVLSIWKYENVNKNYKILREIQNYI